MLLRARAVAEEKPSSVLGPRQRCIRYLGARVNCSIAGPTVLRYPADLRSICSPTNVPGDHCTHEVREHIHGACRTARGKERETTNPNLVGRWHEYFVPGAPVVCTSRRPRPLSPRGLCLKCHTGHQRRRHGEIDMLIIGRRRQSSMP